MDADSQILTKVSEDNENDITNGSKKTPVDNKATESSEIPESSKETSEQSEVPVTQDGQIENENDVIESINDELNDNIKKEVKTSTIISITAKLEKDNDCVSEDKTDASTTTTKSNTGSSKLEVEVDPTEPKKITMSDNKSESNKLNEDQKSDSITVVNSSEITKIESEIEKESFEIKSTDKHIETNCGSNTPMVESSSSEKNEDNSNVHLEIKENINFKKQDIETETNTESEAESETETEEDGEEDQSKDSFKQIEPVKQEDDQTSQSSTQIHTEKHVPAKEDNKQELEEDASNPKRNFNNQIQDIISDIDSNIKAQEKISQLKEQELQLIQKQQELENQIKQQQKLAQQLIEQNRQLIKNSSNSYTSEFQIEPNGNIVNQEKEIYDLKESTNASRKVDLRKIFTPATDAPEILPKNRKLYASSAFYSPTLHPTVEDQVELARRISHSLSDISNQKSKGQSMYVNRKKRSVKWVHEGCVQDYQQYQPKPPTSPNILPAYSDAGKHRVRLNIHQDQLIEKYSKPGVQVVKSPWEAALQTGSASAAFLEDSKFSTQTAFQQSYPPSPCFLHQDNGGDLPEAISLSPTVAYTSPISNLAESHNNNIDSRFDVQQLPPPLKGVNPQRELAYKPNVAQGWRGPNVELPKGLYVPKEISLASYAPPPMQPQQKHQYVQGSSNFESFGCPKTSFNSNDIIAGGFPITKPTLVFAPPMPPKQQLSGPTSYQKFPQSNFHNSPQVNFNPSPLSFDKLSKFEQSEERCADLPNPHCLSARSPYKVRNASPIPFGRSDIRSPVSQLPTVLTQNQLTNHKINNYGHTQSVSQSFNNCARGWGQNLAGSRGLAHLGNKGSVPAENLPYSDF